MTSKTSKFDRYYLTSLGVTILSWIIQNQIVLAIGACYAVVALLYIIEDETHDTE